MSAHENQSGKFLQKMAFAATFGAILFGYDTGVINGALPFMAEPAQLNLTPARQGMVASAVLFGAAIGSLLCGKLSDMYGRRKMLLILSVLFVFTTIGCALSPTFQIIVLFRFFLGLGVGGASVIVPAYLAESSPTNGRGRYVTQNEMMIVVGATLAFIINAILAVTLGSMDHVWRYMIAVAIIPAICLFVGMYNMPESPRWLVRQGKVSQALQTLKKVRTSDEKAVAELEEIKTTIMREGDSKVNLHEFTIPWVRRVLFIAIGIAMCNQLGAINSIIYYGTQILQNAGFARSAAFIGNVANGVISIVATFAGIHLIGKHSRRILLMMGFITVTICHIIIGTSTLLFAQESFFPFFILFMTVTFVFCNQCFIGPLTWLLVSEILPLRLRGTGMGIAILFQWMTNFAIGITFPVLLSTIGLGMTFYIFAIIGLIALTFVKLFVPETKGHSLEQLEQNFRSHGRTDEEKAKEYIEKI